MWRAGSSHGAVVAWRQGSIPLGYPVITPSGIASTTAFGVATVTATYPGTTVAPRKVWSARTSRNRARAWQNGRLGTPGFQTILPVGIASTTTFGNAQVNPPLTTAEMRDLYAMLKELWQLRGLDRANPLTQSASQANVAGIALDIEEATPGVVVVTRK